MADKKNLCAQIDIALHNRVTEEKDRLEMTTSQYIAALLTEYYKMKDENGGINMTGSRTMAFQIPEELFQRIKTHLARETARTGVKLTQRDFVLGLIEQALAEAEASLAPQEGPESAEEAPEDNGAAGTTPDASEASTEAERGTADIEQYCEVMFDKEISGEVPEHRDFVYTTAIPALERRGVKVTVLRSEKTYVDLFTGKITRGPKKGLLRSFPICGRCAVQRDCKLKPILRYQKTLPPDTVQYIGIAKDEQERLLRLAGNRVSLLDKYNCTEEDAKQLCQRAGLLSPVYTFTTRGGCWFCPNAKRKELRHLYDYHPNLWERMLELQALPNKVSEKFNRSETFSDIDAEFRLEDAQESLFQNAA